MSCIIHTVIFNQFRKFAQTDGKLAARYKQATPSTQYQADRDMLFASLFLAL